MGGKIGGGLGGSQSAILSGQLPTIRWGPSPWRQRRKAAPERNLWRLTGGRFSSSLEPENLPPTPIPPTRNARSRVVVGTAV